MPIICCMPVVDRWGGVGEMVWGKEVGSKGHFRVCVVGGVVVITLTLPFLIRYYTPFKRFLKLYPGSDSFTSSSSITVLYNIYIYILYIYIYIYIYIYRAISLVRQR